MAKHFKNAGIRRFVCSTLKYFRSDLLQKPRNRRKARPYIIACLVGLLSGFGANGAAVMAQPAPLVFLSTQARPDDEAAAMRRGILSNAPMAVDFVPLAPRDLANRVAAGRQGTQPRVDVVGALHADLLALAALGDLAPLDDLAARLTGGSTLPDPLLMLGRLGTPHQLYVPWMQAGYVMVANRQALPFLPAGADINALSYDQLAAWAAAIEQQTGKRLLGFPAGREGLIDRFFEGFLYPSYTGGGVVPFRSPAAEAMWKWFAALWRHVNPASANYEAMQHPLLAGDVWIAFDHVARVLPALRAKPDAFVAFPPPAGPRGRGYMPILVGLAAANGSSDAQAAMALIDYLRAPDTQIATARSIGFFPVASGVSLDALDPGLRMAAATLDRMRAAPDALMTLLPVGLGDRGGEFDKIFADTFDQIILHNGDPRTVLDRQAAILQKLISETSAHCWRPDPQSSGPCEIQ